MAQERKETPPVDVDRAWRDFVTYYNTPEGEGRSLYPMEEPEEERGTVSL